MNTILHDLLKQWEDAFCVGQDLSPEQIAVEHPELLPELRKGINAIKDMRAMFGMGESGTSQSRVTINLLTENTHQTGLGREKPDIPGYEILDIIGTGGMGIVYKARHKKLGRLVALKMIRPGVQVTKDDIERFRKEAEAVANFQHPNIVQIHEVSEHEGLPFFSLEYVEGGSLSRKANRTPLPSPVAAELTAAIATAVHAAHEKGIIHRDLKPANILLTNDGNPKVADFGLVKRLDEDVQQTQTGQVLGTPCYMAPEQAAGHTKEIGRPADIYAIGAILYELLTSRPPFQADSVLKTLELVINKDPISPRQLVPSIPRDLDTICLKCLEKAPNRRYETANTLAQDLRRFLDGKPILARPISSLEKVFKFARRQPVVTGLSLAIVIGTIVSFALILWQWREASDRATGETAERVKAQRARDKESLAHQRAEKALEEEAAARKIADQARMNEEKERQIAERRLYFNQIALAELEWRAGNLNRVRHHLDVCPERFRGWEWNYWNRLIVQSTLRTTPYGENVTDASFSPDGKQLATGNRQGHVMLWEPGSGKLIATFTGKKTAHNGAVHLVQWNPDGRYFVTTGGPKHGLKVWNAASKSQVTLGEGVFDIHHVAFSPDGRFAAFASPKGDGSLWDTTTWRKERNIEASPHLAFDPNGTEYVTGDMNGLIKVWSLTTGKQVRSINTNAGGVKSLVFPKNKNGLLTAVCFAKGDTDNAIVTFIDRSNPPKMTTITGQGPIDSVAFDSTGRRILTAGHDGTVRILNSASGIELLRYQHQKPIQRAFWNPGDQEVSCVERGGKFHVWNTSATLEFMAIPTRRPSLHEFAFHPDGNLLAICGNTAPGVKKSLLQLFDLQTKRELQVGVLTDQELIADLSFSEDGSLLATVDTVGNFRTFPTNRYHYRPQSVASLVGLLGVSQSCGALLLGGNPAIVQPTINTLRGTDRIKHTIPGKIYALSRNGLFVLAESAPGTLEVWSTEKIMKVASLVDAKTNITHAIFSRDGTVIATCAKDHTIQVWNAFSGAKVNQFRTNSVVHDVALTDDNKRLAAVAGPPLKFNPDLPGEVVVWDVVSGAEVQRIRDHPGVGRGVAFSPDGTRLATTNLYAIRLWDMESGLEAASFRLHSHTLLDQVLIPRMPIRFSPDGHRLAVNDIWSASVKVWDATPIGAKK